MKFQDVVRGYNRWTGGEPGVWPKALTGGLTRTLVTGLGGALAGRFLAAPVVRAMTFGYGDEDTINRNMAIGGALAGLLGSGIPAYYEHKAKQNPAYAMDNQNPFLKMSSIQDFYRPSIPVSDTMEDIKANPWMSMSDKLTAHLRMAEAAQRDNATASAGLLRPSSLVDFAGQTIATAAPVMLAAYGLSKVLGLPSMVKDTMLGTGLLAGAWKTYLDRSR